jgi:iron complex outermembrane receptor protein
MNLNAEYLLPVEGLSFTGNAGFDYNEFDTVSARSAASGAGFNTNGSLFLESGLRRNVSLDGRFDYRTRIEAIDTELTATLGSTYQDFTRSGQSRATDNQGVLQNPIGGAADNRLISFFGRATFDIKDLFVINGSVNRNGTSRFAPGDRWGTFGSLTGAIKLTNLDFIQNSGVISQLKIRGGYGLTGQQEIGANLAFIRQFTPGQPQASVQFGDQFFTTLRPEGQFFLQWEETSGYNLALDFGLFEDRITGTVDVYQRETVDLLQFNRLADGGLENAGFQNSGSTEGRGIEGNLNIDLIRSADINWSVNLNGTLQEIEITDLIPGPNDSPRGIGGISGGVGNLIQERAIGADPTSFHVFRQVYGADGRPLRGVYVDVNGDNVINEADRVRYKKANPDAFFGFSSNFNYKNFFASFTMRGQVGGYNYNNVNSNAANFGNAFNTPGNFYNNLPTDILNTGFTDQELFSDYYIQSSDFLRMDNATIGYTFNMEDGIDLGFSVTGTNLFIITDYDGLDPEVFNGIDNNLFPRSRGIIFGVNATF